MDPLTASAEEIRSAEVHPSSSGSAVVGDINRLAIALAAMPSSGDLPRFITTHLHEYTQAMLVTFAGYDAKEKVLIPLCIEADSALVNRAIDIIGKKINEIRSPVSDEAYKEIISGSMGVRYSVHDVTFGAVSETVSTVLKMVTGVDRFFGLSYVVEGELFGTTVIALKKNQPDPSREYLESFAFLAAVSLRRMHADAERHRSEERFSAVFHRCPVGITIVRISDGLIVDVNEAILELFEYSRMEVTGATTGGLELWATPDERSRFIDELRKGSIRSFETQFRSKSGRVIAVTINAVTMTLSGEECVLNFVEDITERKRAEEERRKLEQQLIKSQRMESIGTLAGGIAHDFNNLLAMLLGNAELLKTHLGNDPALTKYIDRIIDVSTRGSSITKQLLLFSRHSDVTLEPILLSALIDEVQTMLVHFIPKTIVVKAECGRDGNYISADSGLVHQVILNLCLNARDAMPAGGTLTIAEQRIDASALREKFGSELSGAYVALSVSDTGVGIDEKHLTKIFDPFFTTKEKGKGTGLGLSIVHGIVKSHAGFIDVRSAKQLGTTFTLYFPAIAPPAESVPVSGVPHDAPETPVP